MHSMFRRIACLVLAAPLLCAADQGSDIKLPPGYRDWRVITVAHEEGSLNDLRAVLGNTVAIKAFRKDRRPFPDGTVIARLAWQYQSSPQNNAAFGRSQSFVAGAPTNVQLMVKDLKKFAATGGWGFAQFNDGRPVGPADLSSCFPCHRQLKDQDLVFSHYAP
jgi:hypothetical protein